jgi:hypothetical protein
MSATVALGYPLRRWGVAANRRPVHEVSSRNRWDEPFGAQVPKPMWPADPEPPEVVCHALLPARVASSSCLGLEVSEGIVLSLPRRGSR